MADRFFSKEGLTTAINRDAVANRIVSRINGVQNALMDSSDPTPATSVLFASVAVLVTELTEKASRDGDTEWPKDMEAVIRHIVPIYAHRAEVIKELEQMLISALRKSWEQTERSQGHTRTVKQRIGSVAVQSVQKVRGVLDGMEKWLKKKTGA